MRLIVLPTVSPTHGYPSLDLDRHGCPTRAINDGVHPFDHHPLQPSLYVCRLLCFALDDHLIVADEDWHGPWTFVPTLPQQGQRQLQAVGSGSLDRCVEAVCQPLHVHPPPASERPGLGMAT